MKVEQILELVENVELRDNAYIAKCPSHDDNKNSLSIAEGNDGRILVHCFAGCSHQDVLNSLGLKSKDLFSCSNKPYESSDKQSQEKPKTSTETKSKKIFSELPKRYGNSLIIKRYE